MGESDKTGPRPGGTQTFFSPRGLYPRMGSTQWTFQAARVRDGAIPLVVPESMLVFAAHPDDELLSAGGTILKYADLGCKVTAVVATKGLGGYARREYKKNIDALRQDEFERVTKFLNCEFVELGYDSIEVNRDAIARVTNLIRDVRPQVILLPHHTDVHRAHRRLAQIVREAVYHTATGKAYGGQGREFTPLAVYYYESPSCKFQYIEGDVFVIVDISAYWEQKIAAFQKAYKSQQEVIERALAWAESTAILRGNEIVGEHGEAFIPCTEYVPLRVLLM